MFSVTMGFFDDILIPPSALPHPSRFEEAEQAWVWQYPLEDGAHHDLFMDTGNTFKFKVTKEIFEESSPVGPPVAKDDSSSCEPKIPYRIEAQIMDQGLGSTLWWDSKDEGDGEEEEEEAFE